MYRFRLNSATVAIQQQADGKRLAVIPAGAEVAATYLPVAHNGSDHSKLIAIEWDGKTVSMFLLDLLERGVPVKSAS